MVQNVPQFKKRTADKEGQTRKRSGGGLEVTSGGGTRGGVWEGKGVEDGGEGKSKVRAPVEGWEEQSPLVR